MKKDTKLILIVLAGILAIVLLCVFAVQGTQNKAFTLEEQVNTAQSDIRVQEKRRVDLVYNLADCVMQYDKHEAETLTAIVEGRGSSGDIENVTTAITAVSEAYPDDFSHEHLVDDLDVRIEIGGTDHRDTGPMEVLGMTIDVLNHYREKYLVATKTEEYTGLPAKDIWWQMIQLLPSSYNQKRTVMLNYEVLANIYKSRRHHKLDEWHTLCDRIESLPYSALITGTAV